MDYGDARFSVSVATLQRVCLVLTLYVNFKATSFPGSLSPRPREREKRDPGGVWSRASSWCLLLSSLTLGGGDREILGTRLILRHITQAADDPT